MEIVLASGNSGKLREFQSILSNSNHCFSIQSKYGIEEAVENGSTFLENALIKARHASRHTGLPSIADDSGLEVDILDGRPGIFSARYAGPLATDRDNIDKLLADLNGFPSKNRNARFCCVIVMVQDPHDPKPLICTGFWEGCIASTPKGSNGFGYDPVFYIPALGVTSAQLTPALKNKYSHRAQALLKLKSELESRLKP